MRILTSVFLLAASPAIAECPIAADLNSGVQVTETDGAINLFSVHDEAMIINNGSAPDGYTYRNLLAHGTHLFELGDTENGSFVPSTHRIVDYGIQPAQMPVPSPNSKWEFDTVVDHGGEYSEQQTQSWGALSSLTIGDCTYDMIPGKVTYINSNYTVFEGLHYLPALELALLHSYQIQGEPPSIYVAATIEAIE